MQGPPRAAGREHVQSRGDGEVRDVHALGEWTRRAGWDAQQAETHTTHRTARTHAYGGAATTPLSVAGTGLHSDDVMEAQNDGRVDELSSKVAMLKAVRKHGSERTSERASWKRSLRARAGRGAAGR